MKRLAILGSTGSIGTSVLEFVALHPGDFQVTALAAGANIPLLAEQAGRFRPELISVADTADVDRLAALVGSGFSGDIVSGEQGAVTVAGHGNADTVVSAIVGAAGLVPTMAAIAAGKDIALANKETLVVAGHLVMDLARRKGVKIMPVDSEHSAVHQSLAAGRREDLSRIILTASGGPFRDKDPARFAAITPSDALDHPNWEMGRKISIDSATLMNKGLEVIEARWLFDVAVERIHVLIHPQSIVHSMVEFIDGAVMAQMGVPDMMTPISYALSCPKRRVTGLDALELAAAGPLTFHEVDHNRFPSLALAYDACRSGGIMPAVLNAANEVAVDAFLGGGILFTAITATVARVLDTMENIPANDLETVLDADRRARQVAAEILSSKDT